MLRGLVDRLRDSVLSILVALAVGAVIVALFGHSPIDAYRALIEGSFGSLQGVMQMLAYATPLIFTGLAVAVAFQAGVFNIGGEGQLYVGAFAATLVGIYFQAPWPIPLVASLLTGAIVGAIWAIIPGFLIGRSQGGLVVATIMMNSIGSLLVDFLLRYHFLGPGATTFETAPVAVGALLPRLSTRSQMSYGIVVAVGLCLLTYYILYRTPRGFSFRVIGGNPLAARYAGVRVYRNTILALALSGAICGVGGAVVILGVYGRFLGGFSPGYGWDGIAVALIAQNSPLGVLLSAGLFGVLRAGGMNMDLTAHIPIDLITVIQGLIICLVAAPALWRFIRREPALGAS
jgi:ABC-type uncharacterized transport system permease subunit